MGKKLCCLFGNGVEEIELITPVDILLRCGVDVSLVSAHGDVRVSGAHNIKLVAHTTIDKLTVSNFDGLILPGGPGSFSLKDDVAVLNPVRSFHGAGKLICAICAAPLILQNAGVLQNVNHCAHPCTYDVLANVDKNKRVVVDHHFITAKGPGAAAEFAFAIIEHLHGESMASKIKRDLFF
ncbi:MAG: DJ-1/PfpI family protein [Puniceicoccales bacterium]|jgi:4-methyl-5(b-hydroxyethyl)-thiazole monophosphate biosynthesis|nr:DJ-1/PfpI family protein [Puniceicoccales bacterium]